MISLFKSRTVFVKQNSTLPEVKFPLSQITREKYDITHDMMDNVAVTFSMIDADTGVYAIANAEAKLIITECEPEKLDEAIYTLAYRFKLPETAKAGRFFGEFKLDFLGEYCGKISFPVDSQIQIIIGDSLTKTTVI